MRERTLATAFFVVVAAIAAGCAVEPERPASPSSFSWYEGDHQPPPAYQRYRARSREPYQTVGIYSGRLYGAFETVLYQDFREDQYWIFGGPGAQAFWDLWETDRTIPRAYRTWEATGDDTGTSEGEDFYPYLCVEATFRGRWKEGCRDCIPDADLITIDEFLTMKIVPLEAEECIPAVGSLSRGDWPSFARPRRITTR